MLCDRVKSDKCLGDVGSDRVKRWKPLGMVELYAFIGVQIAMGLCSKSSLDEYWATGLGLTYTPFTAVLARNRYTLISTF